MRGLACAYVAPKLIANGKSHALERSSPARGLRIGQSHGSEARGSGEEGGGAWGDAKCAPSGDAGLPAGHHRGKHLSGLDRFRVRRRHSAHVQRSHRRTLSTKSDGARRAKRTTRGRFSSTRLAKPRRRSCEQTTSTHNSAPSLRRITVQLYTDELGRPL
jgi:hypothetical protein